MIVPSSFIKGGIPLSTISGVKLSSDAMKRAHEH